MKCDIPVPIERLIWFQKRLGLKEEELERLDQYKDLFKDRKVEFSESFFQYFYHIPETKLVLDHAQRLGLLKKAWMQWFESLFKENFSPRFFAYIIFPKSNWRALSRRQLEN